MINVTKKDKSLFESQAYSDTNNKQQQSFPDTIYSQKATSQLIGKKGNKHSKKPTTDDL